MQNNFEKNNTQSNQNELKNKIEKPEQARDSLSNEVLEKISNTEFLNIKRENRLQHITNPSKSASEIQNGDNITFTFKFKENGKINSNLYLKTTAGQLMPPTVKELIENNTIWTRSSLYGEFFNSHGKRLVIHDKTQVVCSKVISEEETKAIEQKIVGENDKYKSDPNYSIILECAKRNISHDVANEIFAPELRKSGNTPSPVDIELLITRFERTKDNFFHDFPNIAIQNANNFAPEFLAYFIAYNGIKLSSEINHKFGITDEMSKTYSIIGSVRVSGSYGTTAPLSETVKIMGDLTGPESIALANKIFHSGPATELMIKLDGGSGVMIKRMIALGYHEGGLKFGRQNADPASGYNYGTFQIGGSNSTPESSLRKYEQCMKSGITLAKQYGIDASMESIVDAGQKDLMTHLGYIESQRGGSNTFAMLKDPNLSDGELVHLMSTKIQGGIDAIGKSVVAQMQHTKIDTTTLTA